MKQKTAIFFIILTQKLRHIIIRTFLNNFNPMKLVSKNQKSRKKADAKSTQIYSL